MNARWIAAGLLGLSLAGAWVASSGAAGGEVVAVTKVATGSRYEGTFVGTVTETSGQSVMRTTLYVAVFADGTMLLRGASAPANKVQGDISSGYVAATGLFTGESLTLGVPFSGSLRLVGTGELVVNYSYMTGAGMVKGEATCTRQK